MSYKIEPVLSNIYDNLTISYEFSSTDGSVLYQDETFLFEAKDALRYIGEWKSYDDIISGYLEYIDVIKEFRYSIDNYNFSNWFSLTDENIMLLPVQTDIRIQVKYDAVYNEKSYSKIVPLFKPDNSGWFNTQYQFTEDFPDGGTIGYVLGYGTNGAFHYNIDTNKFVGAKNNGYWGSPFLLNGTQGNYIPSIRNGYPVDISNATTSGFYPIDDYTLQINVDIVIGSSLQDAIDNRRTIPRKGDYIFINPLTQGIELNGVEFLYIDYTPRQIPYPPYIHLEKFIINACECLPDYSNIQNPVICLQPGEKANIKTPHTLKVFNLAGFELFASEGTNWNQYIDVDFRYSQNSRNWESQWIPLTTYNIKCLKITPLKFFYIEFSFKNISNKNVCIYDIEFYGDFQNITKNSQKLNRFGLRDDCDYGNVEVMNPNNPNITLPPIEWSNDSLCPVQPTFSPYDMNLSLSLYEKLANDVSNTFGWNVDYYRVDPDKSGIDVFLHEYGTMNVVDKQNIKVLIPENKFPEDKIQFNLFDLALFDTFEIHITRKEFHSKFGVGIRPGKDDFINICQINKIFAVEHALSFREFNNSSIYYKLILIKKDDDKHIDNREYSNDFSNLTKNNALDNLFGAEVQKQVNDKVNKQIQENLTETLYEDKQIEYPSNIVVEDNVKNITKPDPVKLQIYADNIEQDIINKTTIISKNYYNLESRTNRDAVIYGSLDNIMGECENRAITLWFNIHTYVPGQVYSLIDNYNTYFRKGYRIEFVDGRLEILINEQLFDFNISVSPNKWYGLVVNIDQTQHKLEMSLHKRQNETGCTTSMLNLINEESVDMIPVSFDSDLTIKLKGSPMYFTNLRIFTECIPKSERDRILNQYIVKETGVLILADNANRVVISNEHKL